MSLAPQNSVSALSAPANPDSRSRSGGGLRSKANQNDNCEQDQARCREQRTPQDQIEHALQKMSAVVAVLVLDQQHSDGRSSNQKLAQKKTRWLANGGVSHAGRITADARGFSKSLTEATRDRYRP